MTTSMLCGRMLPALFAVGLAAQAQAHGYIKGDIAIIQPWSRATAPRADTGAGYMTLRNSGRQPDRLASVSSPRAATVEIHSMTMTGQVMRMRPMASGVPLRPGQTVSLSPGGTHLMLVGLKAPLKQGEMVPLTLHFARAGAITVALKVEAADADMSTMPGMAPSHR
jgi:hypothetical protein